MPRSEVRATYDALERAFAERTFTTVEALGAGIAHHRLGAAVEAGLVHRLRRGHYRLAIRDAESSRLADCLDRLAARGIRVCAGLRTAADIWELPIWASRDPVPPTVLVPRDAPVGKGLRGGVTVKACDVDPHRVVLGPGSIAVTDPLLTAAHLAATRGTTFAQMMVLLCGALRAQLARSGVPPSSITRLAEQEGTRGELAADLRDAIAHADVRGRRGLLAAAVNADPRLETALESISWARFIEARIELPRPQVWIEGASGRFWRVDFLFAGRVIGECDGAMKYGEADSLWKEKKRQADLEAADYVVVRWTWEEIAFHPHVVLARIALALARAAA